MPGTDLTLDELAAFNDVIKRTTERWLKDGLPAKKASDGRVLVNSLDFLHWKISQHALDPRQEKALLDKARREREEWNLKQLQTTTYTEDEIIAEWEIVAHEARKRLLGVATSCAPLIVGVTRVPKAKAILEEKILEALGPAVEPDGAPVPGGTIRTRRKANGKRVGGRAAGAKSRS